MSRERLPPLGTRFWKVWTAATASNVGDGIVLAALPLLATELTRQPLGVAATTIAVRLPWLVFGLFAGVIVDRTDRLRLMIAADLGRVAAFIGIAIIVTADQMTLSLLYLAVFGVGVLETLFDTAAMSMTPALVDRPQFDRANARLNGAQLAANEFAGPPLGGALFAIAAAAPFGINAVTFALSVVLLMTVKGQYRPNIETPTSVFADIKIGFAFLWREPVIRTFAIGAGAINLGFTAAASVLVLHAQDNLSLSAVGFGLLLTSGAVGGILGAASASRIIEGVGRRPAVLASVATMAAGIATMGAAPSAWLAAIGLAAFGYASEIWNIVSVTYRQSVTPDALLGRVMSSFRVIAYGAFPLGAAVGGIVATTTTIRTSFYLGAAVLAALVPYFSVATRRHNLTPEMP